MAEKELPVADKTVHAWCESIPTPFYVYDERAIIDNHRRLYRAFDWVEQGGFTNFFAVKALPNPVILDIIKQQEGGVDCSSYAELLLAQRVGFAPHKIFFTSNNTPIEEYQLAAQLGAYINIDDIGHIDYIAQQMQFPQWVSFRYNPGSERTGNAIIGIPEQAKFGMTRTQLFEAFKKARQLGVQQFGLHTMICSNELNADYFIETARMLFDVVVDIKQQLGITISCVNLGGGMGIPYTPQQTALDIDYIGSAIKELYMSYKTERGMHSLQIVTENGRIITGPYGYLVARVRHVKTSYKNYVGLDATMANLMRPGMYGAYHHLSVVGKNHPTTLYDVTGSLCENNDKFAIDRMLPTVEQNDVVVIHDAGAHGHAMGFNYNGKLRCAEYLLGTDGKLQKIRKAETYENLWATLDL